MKLSKMSLMVMTVAFLCGCGKEEVSYVSSDECVERYLKEHGIKVGLDDEHGRIVEVGTHAFSLKGDESEDGVDVIESYDFPDNDNDNFEIRRFKAMWKAYADGLSRIAESIDSQVKSNLAGKGKEGAGASDKLEVSASSTLNGVVYVKMAESLNDGGYYDVSVAVCQSKKREAALSCGESKPGKYSLAEWIEKHGQTGMICPQSYCDNEGVWWRVAGVPVELGAGRNTKESAAFTETAKHYAYEAALRTVGVRVRSCKRLNTIKDKSDDATIERLESSVKIEPLKVDVPFDSSSIRWMDLDRVDPFTGKTVRCIIAAIPLRNGASTVKSKAE